MPIRLHFIRRSKPFILAWSERIWAPREITFCDGRPPTDGRFSDLCLHPVHHILQCDWWNYRFYELITIIVLPHRSASIDPRSDDSADSASAAAAIACSSNCCFFLLLLFLQLLLLALLQQHLLMLLLPQLLLLWVVNRMDKLFVCCVVFL